MNFLFLMKGLMIGIFIAAPVGPIGVLCIRRTLTEGRLSGIMSGMGAATADAFYGCVAGFGLTFISDVLIRQKTLFQLIGGFFLCWLGYRTLMSKPAEKEAEVKRGLGLIGAYASTFFLTLTNPMTILSFAAIFAGFGVATVKGDYASALTLVAGVFVGSACWWLFLCSVVGALKSKFKPSGLLWVNRISGLIILAFGFSALAMWLKSI